MFIANTILQGDSCSVLQTLPSNFVQTVCTSPPYYGLRSYLPRDHTDKHLEIGLEPTPEQYIEKLVTVFREVRRVLRNDGTLWLNLGDSYAHDNKWGGKSGGKHARALHGASEVRRRRQTGLPSKNLIGIPWRVALALQADGWILRADCIWQKPNGLPESVQDRPTRTHEYLFLLSKSDHYYYDAAAIAEAQQILPHISAREWFTVEAYDSFMQAMDEEQASDLELLYGRNRRSVWSIPVTPTTSVQGHFAIMPTKLAERCILAGTSWKACEQCRAPWARVIARTGHVNLREAAHVPENAPTKADSSGWLLSRVATNRWKPSCSCIGTSGSSKCIVLDPFLGAGTCALVALQWQRSFVGIELNPHYVDLAQRRIAIVQPTLWASA